MDRQTLRETAGLTDSWMDGQTGESPVEGVQQVQLTPVCHVDEDTLNREEAAIFITLRRRVRHGAVEETSRPHLTAARTCKAKVNKSGCQIGPIR